jgi:hypothetical protein
MSPRAMINEYRIMKARKKKLKDKLTSITGLPY